MKEFVARLSSRKFLLTIGALVSIELFPEYTQAIITVSGIYIGTEGVADVVRAYTASKTAVQLSKERIATIETTGEPFTEKTFGSQKIVPGQ